MNARELIAKYPEIERRDRIVLEQVLPEVRVLSENLQPMLAPNRRLEGWPLVGLILGAVMMVFSMINYGVEKIISVSDKSAERAHELARVAIESSSEATVVASYGDAPLWVYLTCLFLGAAIIVWVTRGCPSV